MWLSPETRLIGCRPAYPTPDWADAQVCILESIAIAKVLANMNKYDFCPNTELRALGLSNMIGAGFAAYAATGSFSRSGVINNTGGIVT
jgi:MFS superfamily sulfate permease-like transporter